MGLINDAGRLPVELIDPGHRHFLFFVLPLQKSNSGPDLLLSDKSHFADRQSFRL
jgi:hypothetical protein